ncbi:MAG: adenylate/guanylate cyclase domain-containing response regulator [Bacteroidetes bacterium MedPE-SWsnd-G1]|nr:MAG: adenylate/guanylate cyclase domain-containing response regulator [Bacteroidetes bacterium MedPE-SWsnd-G1]
MVKILVVDDEKDLEVLIKQKFRKKIREKEYEFLFAINGKDAIKKIEEMPDVDVVLSDINMPEMDGLTLLGELNELCPLVKSIMVSAYGDMDNIRTAMNRGAFDFVTKPINFKDLSITVEKAIKQAFQLKETLKAIKENNILKMYVDENVLNFMGGGVFESKIMDNEIIEATVVFIDVCDFTSISESSSPDTVVKMINNYFDLMVNEIVSNDGLIDKFMGDAIMAVFKGEFHLDRAIDSALAIRNKLVDKNATENFVPKVSISIGLKSGEMISGNIGSESLKRLDYTVIGDTVNTASRLQDAANANQIIIAHDCYEMIKESFKCISLGEIQVKNKRNPIKIYEVLE